MLGLVCKHWSEAIRPILFHTLELRDAEDVRFLKNITNSPRITASCLSKSFKQIFIRQEATGGKPWLHHVHGLSTRLRETRFECSVVNRSGNLVSTAGCWALFELVPIVTPSYVRLSILTLDNVVFMSKTELARLIDNFPTLSECHCWRLAFLDPSPVVQSRRTQRRALPTLHSLGCKIQHYLDDRTWDATLQGLLALMPNRPGRASVRLDDRNGNMFDAVSIGCASFGPGRYSVCNYIYIQVKVCRLSASQGASPPLAHVESITLDLSYNDAEVVHTLPLDALRDVINSPYARSLCINFAEPGYEGFKVMKGILCSVLRRMQLTWALESGKLRFWDRYRDRDPITSADILSASKEHTIDGTMITLDINEQAEWLLRPVRFPIHEFTKEQYLRKLVRTRTGGVFTDTSHSLWDSIVRSR
ncbi:uncharacterized protein PHACADRAFT_201086 [Phanerochaete carnosa HHB-10118-sp]|uniref:Uncharacterized protein n=1 Tax=Phanerochaete carnosa (strain HHB-10118-sp) TaxID=650164 RepID=K5UKS2_PHACS|nr:uncharacterized protein PHACADRAFT_201086 [Phanerochaete carnosa HHB-10118-sp]EKM50246.1 hypothetical protein PHACADRAFT_201086 [Phanerochaete carnosa HHB-10118-sp]